MGKRTEENYDIDTARNSVFELQVRSLQILANRSHLAYIFVFSSSQQINEHLRKQARERDLLEHSVLNETGHGYVAVLCALGTKF